MKHKNLILTFFLFLSLQFFAQTPQGINYQGVARNASGIELVNQNIGLQISVLNGSSSGSAVYTETFNLTTDANGLFSLVIGGGTPTFGTFSAIDWSTGGSKWLQVSMDATGGTSYALIGASQFVSVPYALYAKKTALKAGNGIALSNDSIINTKPNIVEVLSINGDTLKLSNGGGNVVLPSNGGKQTIVLTDNVTDVQAAAQIAAEVGPNTQEVIISGTSNLTTVDLSMLTKLISININDNAVLTSVNLGGLVSVVGNFFVMNNPALTTLTLTNLTKVISVSNSQLVIQTNGFTSLTFPALQNITGGNNFINGNSSLTSITFPSLQKMTAMQIFGNSSLSTVSYPVLTDITNQLQFNVNALTTLSMPVLSNAKYLQIQSESSLTNFTLPSLITSGGMAITGNNTLASVSFPVLTNVSGGDMGIYGNPALTSLNLSSLSAASAGLVLNNNNFASVNFPTLTSVGALDLSYNANLNSISIPALASVTVPAAGFSAQNCKLPSSQINSILHTLVLLTPSFTNGVVYLKYQTPAAPPTGAGITDKATL
ncbi:MAG: hypothetical protein ACXVOH_05040, partial [Bacteroidia bacterium]